MRNVIAILFLFAATACSKSSPQAKGPLVAEMKQTTSQIQSLASRSQVAVVTEVTLRKEAVLNRSFLFGSSLQFSSINESDNQVTLMAIALGQSPAEFRVVDNKLRLVSDSRFQFESDVNHPSRLIHEFPILKQDSDTVTIQASQASPVLDTFLFGDKNTTAKRASWIRSFEYAASDELFLIESSVELVDGSIAEFMETLTPREKVVPSDFVAILDDADRNESAQRYRFLDGGKVYLDLEEGRVQTQTAQRFVLKNGQPIRWYVTSNIPDAYLGDVKNGIEAWNRYSRAAGLPDLVKFEGKLPEGVKVGDPRYNIVVWDNIQDAGAAYESQGSDPFTGAQTHSLIYLPYAWINIGKEYWKNAARTEELAEKKLAKTSAYLKARTFMGRSLPVNCIDSSHNHVSEASRKNPEAFARGLLKSVLFHEVGHALGLAHNFKGSLAFDADHESPRFSHSIMDYNHYNEEDGAFFDLEGSDGPVLEYDRQIISVLYNQGKDVRDADPVLAACDDDEADSSVGGVDPLCIRYDIGADPTKQVLRSLDLISNKEARNGRMTSLASALLRIPSELPADAADSKQVGKALANLGSAVRGTVSIYIGGSANSLAYLGSQVTKALYVYRDDVLPDGLVETEMRDRALTLVETVSRLDTLPEATKSGLAGVKELALAWVSKTTAYAQLNESEKSALLEKSAKTMENAFASTEAAVLSRARTRILGSITYSSSAPLSFHSRGSETLDLEQTMVKILTEAAETKTISQKKRPLAERAAVLQSLATFADTEVGASSLEVVRGKIQEEIRQSKDAVERESLRQLLGLVK